MAWRSLQWDNFYSCLLWSSSLCSLLTFKDRHIRCWNGRIQVTSWEVCDHQKHWNALHLFLNWKLTWTTMLYLPTTCSCSKGSFFLFLNFFFWTLKKLESIMHISPLLGMCICPFHMSLPQSEQSSRLGSEFLGIPAPMGSTSLGWALAWLC